MDNAVLLFTRNGMGDAPAELQKGLAVKFLSLLADSGVYPAKILFYTEGVKLACNGSPALEPLRSLEKHGAELILCQTCLDYYGLQDQVAVGIVGGMPDVIEATRMAGKVITL
ncbi:MAG: DsrE family protein [Proteobacteria bacterium]|nr:DsrE family protein [Pseudomonadota bacterium]